MSLSSAVAGISIEDVVYLVQDAQQFWSELEDILDISQHHAPTLQFLDSTLRRFIVWCATYHEQYLQSPLQLEHACDRLLESELFEFHSERMCEILVDETQSNTDPHSQLIFYNVLLRYGSRRADFFRSQKRWQPLTPLLMDHVLVEIDSDVEDLYFGASDIAGGSGGPSSHASIPIEAKLRGLCVRLLYEVCRVQKLDLRPFDDQFIDCLFELVEQTRHMQDETFNYFVIKLIVALNEQFMVASVNRDKLATSNEPQSANRVLEVLIRRVGSSNTFGENMIFMLNRAQPTQDDSCMQLLVLKLLYLLFTTKETSEYFYTNDLCVLVDVFLRELLDLDEDSESLRHTYLRVLHPLLTKTQLRDIPYKRPQIVYALESLISNAGIRDINPTTKRLVDRCLSGDWCVQLRKLSSHGIHASERNSPGRAQTRSELGMSSVSAAAHLAKPKSLKHSKSMEFSTDTGYSLQSKDRRPSNASSLSLVAAATTPTSMPVPKRKGTASSAHIEGTFANRYQESPRLTDHSPSHHCHNVPTPNINGVLTSSQSTSSLTTTPATQRRSAPAPPKRRKPPAVPIGHTNGGASITTIKSSLGSPLAKVVISQSRES